MKQVALIRGINVGRAKRVAMADLRHLVTGLGYLDVRTLLNSGNIIYSVPTKLRADPGNRIERAMATRLGLDARVTALSAEDIAEIMAANPLLPVADNPSRLLVFVLRKPADLAKLKPLAGREWKPEALALGRRAAYLWCPAGIIDSPLAASIAKLLGDGVTSRNWATMTKLHAILSQ